MSPLVVTSRASLIVGCGYLGRRVAARWIAAGRPVAALTRTNADALATLEVRPIVGDVLDPPSLRQLPEAATVLYSVGLDRTAGRAMREVYVEGLGNVLGTLPPFGRFIYISSTSVYGQCSGELVHEYSPTEPREASGKIVLEAERLLHAKRPEAIVLRFAGIYGPDRLLRRKAQLRSGEPLTGDADRWLNLIHVDDGADAVLAAEARGVPGETYNVTDNEPTSRRAFYTRLAELVGAPLPRFVAGEQSEIVSRRVSNAKAKTVLGWRPMFRSYRDGLPSAVTESTSK